MQSKKLVFIFLILMLMACTPKNNSTASASKTNIIFGDDVNKSITISAPEGWNTYKLGNAISLSVFHSPNHTIILKDNNVAIYKNNNGKWMFIENQNSFPATTYIMQPSAILAASGVQVMAFPDLSQLSGGTLLRIVVTANIYDNKIIGKQVLAYVDVTLHP